MKATSLAHQRGLCDENACAFARAGIEARRGAIPMILIFFVAQKQIIQGISAGGLKG